MKNIANNVDALTGKRVVVSEIGFKECMDLFGIPEEELENIQSITLVVAEPEYRIEKTLVR